MTTPLYALSIQQPWIWAICHAGKTVENRTWAPPRKVLGQKIALHASKSLDAEGFAALSEIVGGGVPSAANLVKGGIVATARLAGAVRIATVEDPGGPRTVAVELLGHLDEFRPGEVCASPWSFGPWCWVLEDVTVLDAVIPIGGKLGVWRLPDVFAAAVHEEESRLGRPRIAHYELHGQALADEPRSLRWLLPNGQMVSIPKSQILGESPRGSLHITRWLATKLVKQSTLTP